MEEQKFTRIEAYLMGKLKGPEKDAFDQQLKGDQAFAQEVRLQRQLMDQVETLGALEMKQKLQGIKLNIAKQKRRRLRRFFLGIASAAAIALLLLLPYLNQTTYSPQQIYASSYQAYDLSLNSSRSTANPPTAFLQAGQLYKQGAYTEALPLIESLLDTEPGNSRLLLAKGICHMELEEYTAALSVFNQLIDKKDAFYLEQARWYAALAHLQLDQPEAAQSQLQVLAQSARAFKKEEATQILEYLE